MSRSGSESPPVIGILETDMCLGKIIEVSEALKQWLDFAIAAPTSQVSPKLLERADAA